MTTSSESPVLSPNARYILRLRYLKKDKGGHVIETPLEMFRRVAEVVASAETIYYPEAEVDAWADRFFRIMANLKFLPNSPTILNAGRLSGQLSSCFVLPAGNSVETVSQALRQAAVVHLSGGGTGFSFSRIPDAPTLGGIMPGLSKRVVLLDKPVVDISATIIRERATRGLSLFNLVPEAVERYIKEKGLYR